MPLFSDVGSNFTLLQFSAKDNNVEVRAIHEGGTPPPKITSVEILGGTSSNKVIYKYETVIIEVIKKLCFRLSS